MRAIFWLGAIFIFLGIAFVVVPVLESNIDLDDVPSWLVFVYKEGNFYFATSPILILISAVVFIVRLIVG